MTTQENIAALESCEMKSRDYLASRSAEWEQHYRTQGVHKSRWQKIVAHVRKIWSTAGWLRYFRGQMEQIRRHGAAR